MMPWVWLLVSMEQKRTLYKRHLGSKVKDPMDTINISWILIALFLTRLTRKTCFESMVTSFWFFVSSAQKRKTLQRHLGSKAKEFLDTINSSWIVIASFLTRWIFKTNFENIMKWVWLLISSAQKKMLCETHLGSKMKELMDAINSS